MVSLFLSLLILVPLHLATMAAVGSAIGVIVQAFSLGLGPTLFHFGVFRLGLIPLGGYVKFRGSRGEPVPPEEMNTTFDGRSTFEQLLIVLSGCAVLLGVGYLFAGGTAVQAFSSFPYQALAGALSPYGEAQTLLEQGSKFLTTASPSGLFGVVAAKFAALNLLPFPVMNGGAALAILGRRLGSEKWWPLIASVLILLVQLAIAFSWAAALAEYKNNN